MAIWYVCGQDQMYRGLHGMKICTIEVGTEDDAMTTARGLSYEVMDSYEEISDSLEAQIAEECWEYDINYNDSFTWSDEDGEKIDEIKDEVYEENLDFFCVELDESKLPTLDPYELDEILHKIGAEEFLKEYRLEVF